MTRNDGIVKYALLKFLIWFCGYEI